MLFSYADTPYFYGWQIFRYFTAACARVRAFSRIKISSMWPSTVRFEISKRAAISLSQNPAETMWMISRWRGESGGHGFIPLIRFRFEKIRGGLPAQSDTPRNRPSDMDAPCPAVRPARGAVQRCLFSRQSIVRSNAFGSPRF